MEEHTLRVLEFEKVIARLQDQAACALGREVAGLSCPTGDLQTARRKQRETSEARAILQYEHDIPLGGIHDIRSYVERAAIDALLAPHELLSIQSTLHASARLGRFLAGLKEKYPLLCDLGSEIESFEQIELQISKAVSQNAEVLDAASPGLSRVRNELRTVQARLTERMQSYLQSAQYRSLIQEPVVTLRDDRYCIPVKAEHRGQFPGIVHDSSASGATVFIEPAAVVELGNSRRQLVVREREEVEKVLAALTAEVGRSSERILATLNVVGMIDAITARAKLSIAQGATEPALNDEGWVELRGGRHPLLSGEVVPIDLDLGREFGAILITGPNTGGKTVSLKTIGLLTVMASSGLHVPAEPGTSLCVFREVFADIGDEQSIEQSLSTFSSHMNNIVRITRAASSRSLALLDEIGAGTDPAEGAALAKAVLNHLLRVGAKVVATTHYGELKEFAYQREGIVNASVEFDPDTLRPTYRLRVGIPGSSNAFAIAARLGLAPEIIDDARAGLAEHTETAEELIRRLEDSSRAAEQDRRAAQRLTTDAEALRRRYEEQLARQEHARSRVEEKARGQARAVMESYSRKLDATLEQLARQKKDSRRAQDLKKKAEKLIDDFERRSTASPEPESRQKALNAHTELAPGVRVGIVNVGQDGVIVEPPQDGRVVVRIGVMRVTVPLSSLRQPRERAEKEAPAAGAESTIAMEKARDFSREIHLRGMRAEVALTAVDKYLDDAMAAGVEQVRIIHGKGTGTLRKVVWELLKQHPGVQSYRLGEQDEGGSGATVVAMKR